MTADRQMAGYPLEYLKGFENDTLQSVLSAKDDEWRAVGRTSVAMAYTSTPYWFRLHLDVKPRPGRWYLELDWPQLDTVDVYFLDGDGRTLASHLTGDSLPFAARPVNHPHFVYPLPDLQGAMQVYFRVKTNSLFYFTPILWNELETREDGRYVLLGAARYEFWQMVFFGIMLTMTVYNLFIFYITRDQAYIGYVAYCLFFILYHCSLSGLGHKYLWGGWPFLDEKAYMIFAFMSYASAAFFVSKFLRLRENGHRRLDWIAWSLVGLWLLSTLLSLLFRESVVIAVTTPLALATCLMGVVAPFYTWRKNDIFGLYFLVAWLMLLVGTIAFVLLQNGIVDANWFTLLGGQQLGAALETILISLALSHRFKALKESTLESQQRLLNYVQKYSSVLEEKMLSRLSQIEDARRRHVDAQQNLAERDKMVSLDLLTNGIYNELSAPRTRLIGDLNLIREKTIELAHFVADLLREDPDKDIEEVFRIAIDDLIRPMEMMSSGHFRIASLLQQMRSTRNFAKGDKVRFPLRDAVAGAVERVSVHYPQVVCNSQLLIEHSIEGWPAGLEEALLQIIKNAFQAAASRKPGAEGLPEVSISMALDAGHLYVSVSDNGPGMDAAIMARIFDPFFTTRNVGEGSGLGLTMARELIDRHDGIVECLSSSESGTRMLVRFTT